MVSIYCPHCHKHTALSHAMAAGNLEAIWNKNKNQIWWIGICNSCKNPVLVLNNGAIIYPYPLPSPTDPNIPKELADDLNEAKMCFSVSCYRACVIMSRRCIQLACIMKGAKKEKLADQIDELKDKGIITQDIKEWATVVRWVGNDGAHPNKNNVTKKDAEDCLKLAEQFLYVVFVASAIAQSAQIRRNTKKKNP